MSWQTTDHSSRAKFWLLSGPFLSLRCSLWPLIARKPIDRLKVQSNKCHMDASSCQQIQNRLRRVCADSDLQVQLAGARKNGDHFIYSRIESRTIGPVAFIPSSTLGEEGNSPLTSWQLNGEDSDKPWLVTAKTDSKARSARTLYKKNLDVCVRHAPQFGSSDLVYAANAPKFSTLTSSEDPSRKLKLIKAGLFQSNREHSWTVVVEEDSLFGTVSTARMTIARQHDEDDNLERRDASKDIQTKTYQNRRRQDAECV